MAGNTDDDQFLYSYTHNLSDSTALKVYLDSNPHNLKTAPLQKGLILLFKGVEVIGEGMGFGAPIIRYGDETYFSGKASLWVSKGGRSQSQIIIRKEYYMNLIHRDQFCNLSLENLAFRRKIARLDLLYQKNKPIATLTCKLKPLLFSFGVQSNFVESTPRGKVTATYKIDNTKVKVNLEFEELYQKNLQQIFILNEQAAHFFKKYKDSKGLELFDDSIGVWDPVTASVASVAHVQDQLGFAIKAVEGATLRRGREVSRGALDWTGLDFEISDKIDKFEYEIEVLEKK
jgi:hypothetical protein